MGRNDSRRKETVQTVSDFSIEQQRAIAIASARMRLQGGGESVTGGERLKHASDSFLTNMPDFPKSLQEFATGGTGLLRGIANLPSRAGVGPAAGDIMFPPQGDPESGFRTAGEIADPIAWAIGGGVPAAAAKTLGRLVSMGPAAKKVAEAMARNWAGSALGRGAVGGATGATIGALSDRGDAETGAAVGAAANVLLPPAASGVMRGATAVKEAIYPSPGGLAVRAAGDKADDVIAALQNAKSGVPGLELNVGQASVPANSAEFAALQKLAASKDPSRYVGPQGVQGQQEAARRAAVQTVGKTPGDLHAAEAARSSASKVNYSAAYQQAIKGDPELARLSANPYFRDELPEALRLAEANGISPKTNLTEFLQFVKEGIDSKIQAATKPDAPAISNATKAALTDAKNRLVTWLGKKNPAYEFARTEHARLSRPINQMKLGQELERALVAPATEAERVAGFGGALRKAETQISKATGGPRIEDLTPRQRKVMDAIEANLKLDADYKKLAGGGMSNLENRIGAPTAPPTGIFQPMLSAARSWLNTLLGSGHEKALHRLAPIMEKDPQNFAKLMQAATPQQRQAINSMLADYMARGATVAGGTQ